MLVALTDHLILRDFRQSVHLLINLSTVLIDQAGGLCVYTDGYRNKKFNTQVN